MSNSSQVQVDKDITSVVIAYKNGRMIADDVLPRFSIGKKNYTYWEFPLDEAFNVPETSVARRGKPNEVLFSVKEHDGTAKDYGLDEPVPNDDVSNAPDSKRVLARRGEMITDIIILDREIRVAGMVQDSANYLPENVVAVTDEWDGATPNNPIPIIRGLMTSMIMRPNVIAIGRELWDILAVNPFIVKACGYTDTGVGVASRDDVAKLFEIERLLVGEAKVNINRKGQAPEIKHAWGKSLSLHFLDALGGPMEKPTFGFTAQYGTRLGGTIPDPHIGMRGGTWVRVGETVEEKIVAPALGALINHP